MVAGTRYSGHKKVTRRDASASVAHTVVRPATIPQSLSLFIVLLIEDVLLIGNQRRRER